MFLIYTTEMSISYKGRISNSKKKSSNGVQHQNFRQCLLRNTITARQMELVSFF